MVTVTKLDKVDTEWLLIAVLHGGKGQEELEELFSEKENIYHDDFFFFTMRFLVGA